jgi:hypothetical protein
LSNIAQLKRQKEYPNEQMEGDTDVEHMFPMVHEAPIISNKVEITGYSNPTKKKGLTGRGEKRKNMARRQAALLR